MQEFFESEKDENCFEERKVKEYINRYLKELQRHFDMSDSRIRTIIFSIYQDLSPYNFIKLYIKKQLDMLKSLYKKCLRGKNGN